MSNGVRMEVVLNWQEVRGGGGGGGDKWEEGVDWEENGG